MEKYIIYILGAIVILAVVAAIFIYRSKSKSNKLNEKSAKEFIEGLSKAFYEKAIEVITNVDLEKLKNYSSIEEFEIDILNLIYDTAWEYTKSQLKTIAEEDILAAAAIKLIDKDMIINSIKKIDEELNITGQIENIWNTKMVPEINKQVEIEDSQLQEKFNDETNYIQEVSKEDMVAPVVEEHTEEELAELNPPSDEDPVYDDTTDSSVEVIEEDFFFDAKGRKRNKKTGRYM